MKEHVVKERGIVLLTEDLCPEWLTFMKEAKLNVLGVHVLASNGKSDSIDEFLKWLDEPSNRDLLRSFEEEGIAVEFELHAMSWLLDRQNFAKHPEWFRTDQNGKRNADLNFCCSSKEAMQTVCENTYKLASRLKQNSHRYYFWLDDAPHGHCHCPLCKDLSASDQNVLMLNEMLKALRTYDPEASLAYLAYKDALIPPRVKPDPGVFLEFAPIDRNMTQPLEEQKEYPAVQWLDDLLKVFDKESAHILEYWFDVSLFSRWKKPPVRLPFYEQVMKTDVEMYASRGVSFITSFGCFIDQEYIRLYGVPPIKEYGDILYAAE